MIMVDSKSEPGPAKTPPTATNTAEAPFPDPALVPPLGTSSCVRSSGNIRPIKNSACSKSHNPRYSSKQQHRQPHTMVHPYSSSSHHTYPNASPLTLHDGLDIECGCMCRREGDGVPDGEIDCFDVDIVLECDDTVIGESGSKGRRRIGSFVDLACRGPSFLLDRECRELSNLRTR